jgi:hypothetical protein
MNPLRSFAALLLALLTMMAFTSSAFADLGGAYTEDGIDIGADAVRNIQSGLDPRTGTRSSQSYEYRTEVACSRQAQDDPGAPFLCRNTNAQCDPANPDIGPGPLTRVLRRELDAGTGAPVGAFEVVGLTCFPDGIPNGKRTLGLAQIIRAFNETKFAKPQTHLQPEGNVTLVTLPVYFSVSWPTAGYQPQEVDAVNLLGYDVRIRPTLEHFTYVFGDGTTFGPTTSAGGRYPDGDITRTYAKAGSYSTHVDITYGGEFSVNGGAWTRIPDTVAVPGAPQTLTVRTAKSRLVSR